MLSIITWAKSSIPPIVSFPALPGCVTYGKDFEHAQAMAQGALDLWLEDMIENKESLPESDNLIVSSIASTLSFAK